MEESSRTHLYREALTGRMSRRQVLRRAAVLGLSAPAIAALLAACGSGSKSTPTTSSAGASTSTSSATTATTASTTAASPSSGATATMAETSTATTAAATATTPSASASTWMPRDVTAKLTGSGSSFVDPAMQLWVQKYKDLAPNVSINYQSVGSGQGKKDFIGGVTDFGGTDAFMTDDELKQAPGSLHIPVVLGPEAVTFNLQGIDKLQLSGPTIADIYLGKVTKWNDPEIAADNPGVTLPDTAITVVHRSDGSGTTAIFTNYLSKVSDEWSNKVGFSTAVQWPVGIGGPQNPGVAAAVQQTPGAIGYVELAYAIQNNLPAAAVKNAAGKWVVPSLDGASADAAGFVNNLPDDLRLFITNAPEGDATYPITGFSWVLLRPSYDDADKAKALTDFCYYCITQGQQVSATLQYAPLPDQVLPIETKKLESVQSGGQDVFTAPAS